MPRFPRRSIGSGRMNGGGSHSTVSCSRMHRKLFFTLHFAREVENSWSMREICHINVQALYQGHPKWRCFASR